MRINLVLPVQSRGWIIEKITNRLRDGIRDIGHTCEVSGDTVSECDVNHAMVFHYTEVRTGTLNTMFVTHVDDQLKMNRVKQLFRSGVDAALCMSSMTVEQMERAGIDPRKLTWISPGHDQLIRPRPIVIGITTNLYADGRKREWMLDRLAADMDLSAFEFRIFGRGWDGKVESLKSSGAAVRIFSSTDDCEGDYEQLRQSIRFFDYYLYMGLDEGSLGTIDALAAGVPTIVTTQGFHVDLPGGITHGFWEYAELLTIFKRIVEERDRRVASVALLSWRSYAESHVRAWHTLRSQGVVERPEKRGDGAGGRQTASLSYLEMLVSRERRRRLKGAVKARIKRLWTGGAEG